VLSQYLDNIAVEATPSRKVGMVIKIFFVSNNHFGGFLTRYKAPALERKFHLYLAFPSWGLGMSVVKKILTQRHKDRSKGYPTDQRYAEFIRKFSKSI